MLARQGYFMGPVPAARLGHIGKVVEVMRHRDPLGRRVVAFRFEDDGYTVVTSDEHLVLAVPAGEEAA